jgi:hypothetical protein
MKGPESVLVYSEERATINDNLKEYQIIIIVIIFFSYYIELAALCTPTLN